MLDFEVHYEASDADALHLHNLYKPVPAKNFLPEWFKKLSPTDDHGHLTGKSCRGIFDVMASGYMMLWPFDAEIYKDDNGKLAIKNIRKMGSTDFSPHPHFQIEGYPDLNLQNQAEGVQKLVTPYRIKTPPGTSMLMTQPAYRPDLRVEVAPGIIDTDGYYGTMNVLFMIKETNSKRRIKISAGTPIAQLIPFVRGEWQLTYGGVEEKKAEANDIMAENIDKFYQKHMWDRKVFKDEAEV